MAGDKYDGVFLQVLNEEGHLVPFLDTVFGFLYRCTDFYQIQHTPNEKLGFPEGKAEQTVLSVLHKWQSQAKQDYDIKRLCSSDEVPPAIQEFEISDSLPEETPSRLENTDKESPVEGDKKELISNGTQKRNTQKGFQSSGDSYNGAVYEGYRWSQSIMDLDVQIRVPNHVLKGRDVRVAVTATHLTVSVVDENTPVQWKTLVDGEFCWKTNKEESVWSLVSGQYVQLHLEKCRERWWDALFTTEPKIDLRQIDASRPMDDLPQEEQMKIQELMWNQERKREQVLPTSENLAVEKILQEAWNKEGSPFKGQPYDPKQW